MTEIHNSTSGMFATSQENKMSEEYVRLLSKTSLPNAHHYTKSSKTLFRALGLGYHNREMRYAYEDVINDRDIQDSYRHMQNLNDVEGRDDVLLMESRNHLKRCLSNSKFHHYFKMIVEQMKDKFYKYAAIFRLHRSDPADPFYQAPRRHFHL